MVKQSQAWATTISSCTIVRSIPYRRMGTRRSLAMITSLSHRKFSGHASAKYKCPTSKSCTKCPIKCYKRCSSSKSPTCRSPSKAIVQRSTALRQSNSKTYSICPSQSPSARNRRRRPGVKASDPLQESRRRARRISTATHEAILIILMVALRCQMAEAGSQ